MIDLHLMKEIQRAETRAGLLTKSLRITHVLWATNEYLASTGKRETDKCPLCGKDGETNAHLKSHCPEASVKAIRSKMISDIASMVQEQLGESMPDEAWQAVANMWSQKRLEEAHPEDPEIKLSSITCRSCKKRHNCRWRGRKGHLPAEAATGDVDDGAMEEYEGLDEHVKAHLEDMAKPGARTTWMGWFPQSFTRLLTSFHIPTRKAQELALKIRNVITIGMDDIWRERNAAQHTPNERKDINPRVHEAFEQKNQLGLDQGPHASAQCIRKRSQRFRTGLKRSGLRTRGNALPRKRRTTSGDWRQ